MLGLFFSIVTFEIFPPNVTFLFCFNELWVWVQRLCTFCFPRSGEGFICQQARVPQQGMWKMARVSYSTCSLAGNNPDITCRDDVLMILLMKRPGLSSGRSKPALSVMGLAWIILQNQCSQWGLTHMIMKCERVSCEASARATDCIPTRRRVATFTRLSFFFNWTLKLSMPFIARWDVGRWHICPIAWSRPFF